MNHCAVRGVLYRLNRLAKQLFSDRPRPVRVRKGGRPKGSVGPNEGQFKPLVEIEGDLLQQVLNRRAQGASIALMAEEFEMPRVTLTNRLRKLGIDAPPPTITRPNPTRFKPKFFLSEQEINEIASRWKSGESLESISRLGHPFQTAADQTLPSRNHTEAKTMQEIVTVNITGLDEIQKKLEEELPKDARLALRIGLSAGAGDIKNAMVDAAPVEADGENAGFLRDHLKVKTIIRAMNCLASR